MASAADPIPPRSPTAGAGNQLERRFQNLQNNPHHQGINGSQDDEGGESSSDDSISPQEQRQHQERLDEGARNAATIRKVPEWALKKYKSIKVKKAFLNYDWDPASKKTFARDDLDHVNQVIRQRDKTHSGPQSEYELPVETIIQHFDTLKPAFPLENNAPQIAGIATFIATMVQQQVPIWSYVPQAVRDKMKPIMKTEEMKDALQALMAQDGRQVELAPSSEKSDYLQKARAGVVQLLKDASTLQA
ncbi:MAG: hypothetical protein M1812_005849 [Candelaria pacifica]|nr:MAG: hypothetical protein M1812_005849 [Candelaria pacifica]